MFNSLIISALLVTAVLLPTIIIQQSYAQIEGFDVEKSITKNTEKRFDLCLPIKKHINDTIIDPKVVAFPPLACTQVLGIAKDTCWLKNDTYGYCKDPRYLSWLANDYHAYPPGTWDFKDLTGHNVSPR